jgi:hypothetical protein
MDKKEEKGTHDEMDKLLEKVSKLNPLDLSADEDLSIAIMNLISIEEHLYFSGMKTSDEQYFKLLENIREMRVRLLKEIVKEGKGETWCISKHLLAAAMRLMEVGTKLMTRGKKPEAYKKFEDAFNLYSIFWGLNLKIDGNSTPSKLLEEAEAKDKKTFGGKMQDIVKKVIDCCREL